jgi:hypothetical protein
MLASAAPEHCCSGVGVDCGPVESVGVRRSGTACHSTIRSQRAGTRGDRERENLLMIIYMKRVLKIKVGPKKDHGHTVSLSGGFVLGRE